MQKKKAVIAMTRDGGKALFLVEANRTAIIGCEKIDNAKRYPSFRAAVKKAKKLAAGKVQPSFLGHVGYTVSELS